MTVHRPFYLLENCDKSNSRYCRLPITRQCEIGTLGVNLFLQASLSEVISVCLYVRQPDKVFKILHVRRSVFSWCQVNTDRKNLIILCYVFLDH